MKKRFKMIDPSGMHARPATKLVKIASKFEEEVIIRYEGKEANAKSIMNIMSLGIVCHTEFEIDSTDVAIQELETEMKNEGLI